MGGLDAQVSAYAPGLWEHFGVTFFTVWDLDALEFSGCCTFIDRERARAEREAKEG